MSCKYYGHSGIAAGIAGLGELIPTGGNQCGLITDAHSPCWMEMERQVPEWGSCPLNPERAIMPIMPIPPMKRRPRFDMGYYILGGEDGHTPIHVDDTLEWAKWFEESNGKRIVKQENIGGFFISTVFLGLDHSHRRLLYPNARPEIFETMTFTGPDCKEDLACERCSTWAEAEAQHKRMADAIRRGVNG